MEFSEDDQCFQFLSANEFLFVSGGDHGFQFLFANLCTSLFFYSVLTSGRTRNYFKFSIGSKLFSTYMVYEKCLDVGQACIALVFH